MTNVHQLNDLDPHTFEHLANTLAMRVLGLGHTTFGPGRDGGRDGFYEGEAAYPSEAQHWNGTWYLQSKFHRPHLTSDAQKWLIEQLDAELKAFSTDPNRHWPDNWIIATNVEITAVPGSGSFDRTRELVTRYRPELVDRFHIWGGNKILALLALYPSVAEGYAHFITPGHVLAELLHQMGDAQASVDSIVRFLVVKQLEDQQHTRLEQAGSSGQARPGIHRLFIDLPFRAAEFNVDGLVTNRMLKAAARPHRAISDIPDSQTCRSWRRHPDRARVWFIKAGPGHGKSTIGQYFCQVARAAIVLTAGAPAVTAEQRTLAEEIRSAAIERSLWPSTPRIPISVDLKDYAQWYAGKGSSQSRGILTFLAERIGIAVEQPVAVGTIRRMLKAATWFAVFDGLDEVPQDVKDDIASEVKHFIDHVAVEAGADLMSLCTSRPQGYSGQFADIDGPTVELASLSAEQALACAQPLLRLDRSDEEFRSASELISRAIESPSVRELMTTPLQSHIMAVIVRDGGRPPDRRWQLYSKFYDVIRKREANKNFLDVRLAKLLREDEQLLKTVHTRLGFLLHSRAETSDGAQTHLSRAEFKVLVTDAVTQLVDRDVELTVATLMAATVNRLVLVSTPDDGDHVRFDIRPLQEFFAAEFLYEAVTADKLEQRLAVVGGDSHWREVMHFLLSALVESVRRTELVIAIRSLERLNGEETEGEDRIAARRLARGAVIAGRLLSEGVLEQDRRVRGEFKRAIEPLMASTEAGVLRPFEILRQPASLSWLCAGIRDALREAAPAENVGAGALALTLECDNEHVVEVVNSLGKMTAAYLDQILAPVSDDEDELVAPNSQSAVKIALSRVMLCGTRWRTLTQASVGSMIVALRSDRDSPAGLAMWIAERERRVVRKAGIDAVDFGVLRGQYGIDWATAGQESLAVEIDTSGACDFAVVVARVMAFYNAPSVERLTQVFDVITPEQLTSLPSVIQRLLPINLEASVCGQVERLVKLGESDFQTLLRTGAVGPIVVERRAAILEWGGRFNHDGWKRLVLQYPRIAVSVWSDRVWPGERRAKAMDSRRTSDVLIARLLKTPELLRDHPTAWGRLVKAAPDRERELRSAFLRCAQAGPPMSPGYASFSPLHLDLPSEAALVPFVLTAALARGSVFQGENPDLEAIRSRLEDCGVGVRRQAIAKYGSLAPLTRVALQLAAIIGSGDLRDVDGDVMVEAYDVAVGAWIFETFAAVMRVAAIKESHTARRVVGRLLNAARDDYQIRSELDPLLSWWREVSVAPVTTGGYTASWLGGTS